VFVFPFISHAEYDEETKFGFYADRFFISTHTILFDEALNKRINEIGNRVAKASGKLDVKYTFRVVNDPIINAYSAAGGYIYINTGLLDVLESEDELASVVAHEIAHTNKGHQIGFAKAARSAEISSFIIGSILSAAIATAISTVGQQSDSPVVQGVTSGALISGIDSQFAGAVVGGIVVHMLNGYGTENEIEADTLAIQYTKKAGYNPNAAINVFKRMINIRDRLEITENNYVSKLINAEPGLEERIKNAEDTISKAK
jgi:predicted Zn-dependent protease